MQIPLNFGETGRWNTGDKSRAGQPQIGQIYPDKFRRLRTAATNNGKRIGNFVRVLSLRNAMIEQFSDGKPGQGKK